MRRAHFLPGFPALPCCWLALLLALLPFFARAEHPGSLTLAIHPYLPYGEVVSRFTPLARHLEAKLKRPVHLQVATSYREHIDRIGADQVDIAFVGPASYVRMASRHGDRPILGKLEVNGKPDLIGVIFVRRESAVRELAGLKGRRVAFTEPESTMGYLVPRYLLEKQGLRLGDLARHEFLGNHPNVALAVLAGDFDAGAVKQETFEKFKERGLRALALTPPIPEHLFVARRNLPAETAEALRGGLAELGSSEAGSAILRAIAPDVTAIVTGAPSDYAVLRDMVGALDRADRIR